MQAWAYGIATFLSYTPSNCGLCFTIFFQHGTTPFSPSPPASPHPFASCQNSPLPVCVRRRPLSVTPAWPSHTSSANRTTIFVRVATLTTTSGAAEPAVLCASHHPDCLLLSPHVVVMRHLLLLYLPAPHRQRPAAHPAIFADTNFWGPPYTLTMTQLRLQPHFTKVPSRLTASPATPLNIVVTCRTFFTAFAQKTLTSCTTTIFSGAHVISLPRAKDCTWHDTHFSAHH